MKAIKKDFFTSIVGNHALRQRLGEDILNRTLPHAMILEGPRGTGKHTLARLCAAALVCEKKDHSTEALPCLTCLSCKKVLEGKFPDLITVGTEGKTTIGVDTVRFLREDITVIPNDSEYKIYLIEDSDKMTAQAQNALLLTLEEPPSYIHFFLLCENAELLLETIRSRAPILRTEPIPMEQMDQYLCEQDRRAAQMKLADPQGYAELLISARNGIGQALGYLDGNSFLPVRQKRALATEFLSVAIKKGNATVMVPLLLRFSSKRDLLLEQLLAISDALRDLILLKKNDTAILIFYANRDEAIDLCDRVSIQFLYQLKDAIHNAIEEIKRNANVRLTLIKMMQTAQLL